MTSDGPSRQKLDDLLTDLRVERSKLNTLVESLRGIERSMEQDPLPPLWVDTVALRLENYYTGIERCFVLIVRVINGATPDGADWHRRLLDRMAVAISRPTNWRPRSTGEDDHGHACRFIGFAPCCASPMP